MATDVIYRLRSVGTALFTQGVLYGQLAYVEFTEEKRRWAKLLCASLIGFACLLCLMLFLGVAVLAASWDTTFRMHAIVAVIAIYSMGLGISVRYIQAAIAAGEKSFSATRAEIAADIALIKSKI